MTAYCLIIHVSFCVFLEEEDEFVFEPQTTAFIFPLSQVPQDKTLLQYFKLQIVPKVTTPFTLAKSQFC